MCLICKKGIARRKEEDDNKNKLYEYIKIAYLFFFSLFKPKYLWMCSFFSKLKEHSKAIETEMFKLDSTETGK